jgi:LacI family transcriptional regulator
MLFLPCYRDERMLQGICEFAYKHDWELDSYYYHTGTLPQKWDGDGIITMLHIPGANPELSDFIRRHRALPIVDLSRNNESIQLTSILQDNPGIGRLGAEHFAHSGLRHVGFLAHTMNHFHEERYKGFHDRSKQLGLDCHLIHMPDNYLSGHRFPSWLLDYVKELEEPFGIMAAADYLAQWATRACAEAGFHVPNDIALLGVDNCREICELSPVALSSIDNNAFRHGYEAAHLLQRMLDGELPPKEPIRIPVGALHVRASSNILTIAHPHVATSLRFIASHYTDRDLTIDQVAAQVPISKRRLHDAFMKYVGRSVTEEITHRRIQSAIKQIKATDGKLWDISDSVGFKSPEVMSRLFSRKLGHPPSKYR